MTHPLESISQDQAVTLLAAFGAAILGGAVSLVSTLVLQKYLKNAQAKQEGAANAFSGSRKLERNLNILWGVKDWIDKGFEDAHGDGLLEIDPGIKIQPPLMFDPDAEKLTTQELSYLAKCGNFELLSEIELSFLRTSNIKLLVRRFSQLRLEMNTWMEGHPEIERRLSGQVSKDSMPLSVKPSFDMRVAQLNNLIGCIVSWIEEEMERAQRILDQYVECSHKEFGELFPKFKIVGRTNENQSEAIEASPC